MAKLSLASTISNGWYRAVSCLMQSCGIMFCYGGQCEGSLTDINYLLTQMGGRTREKMVISIYRDGTTLFCW